LSAIKQEVHSRNQFPMKAPVVALFLVLEVTQALWLHADEHQEPPAMPTMPTMPSAWGPPATPPAVRPGTGELLSSGDAFALESEAQPGLFVTLRLGRPNEMGAAMKWLEMRHITNGPMGLESGINEKSTFSMYNMGKDWIKSGDMTKWTHGGTEQIDLLMAFDGDNAGEKSFMWPHPLVKKKLNLKEQGDFLIEHAREVDLKELNGRPDFLGSWGFDQKVRQDPRKGEPIKDGDSVWIRHRGTTGNSAGDWLWMSGDPAEGFHVAFPHHYPGFDGQVKHYAIEHWNKGGNDPHATAQRFTVRKVASQQGGMPQQQQKPTPQQYDYFNQQEQSRYLTLDPNVW
jgi:hypothetical protein